MTLAHLMKRPLLSIAYLRLARREADLIGTRQSVPWLAAWWRPLHIILAWLFVGGMITHIIVVSFFAGYVAEGRFDLLVAYYCVVMPLPCSEEPDL